MQPNTNESQNDTLIPQEEQLAFLQEAARSNLINFAEIVKKGYRAEFFHEIIGTILQEAAEKVKRKEKVRIILSVPPRHGKTELASSLFPAWALGRYPEMKFILSSYGADLSETIGMKTRDIINSETYQMVFPGITLRPDVKAKAKWMTNKDGSFTGVGMGTAVTGTGADFVIIDDPHKDRAEAESQTVRESVWEYYRSTLYSRLEGFGAIVIIMQRWHTEDLVGKVKEESKRLKEAGGAYDEWEIINFPAVAEDDESFRGSLVRKAGEALWPSKFGLDVLENIKQTSGIYNWVSQYMQDPIATEAQEFKEFFFRYFEEADLNHKRLRYYTLVDPAISQKTAADNTVVLTVAKEVDGPNIYRIREDAGHFTPEQTLQLIFAHQAEYRSEVAIEVVQYQMALKYSVIEEQRKRQIYFTVHEIKSGTNKESRIRGLLPLYSAGVVFHRKGDIEYERETLSFPRGRRDDRIDAMSMFLLLEANTSGGAVKQYRPAWKSYGKKQ